ncbi:uncharacterized protein LOC100833501 isoform X1 [Brachypodium distachyon]|uniref:Uncharacterized protein n=1 Tax=Brachypodium distachyon TaxID=15368 RepID=A0A2K2D0M7_BRADI|nr:uncharacterized protein LOC100833501 isoform X1 [Brachypodium distachyon]PNT67827.1 hypothetical protein BRADI_3g32567v3 [Brachypodium distachyon]|eukprot:XP_024318032.1 uncharacterized protein LOC100833501 isoform X1 [Brachypodium distachyon]
MAAAVGLEDAFGASVFGGAMPEGHPTPHPVLFRAHARSAAALRVVATDCHSLAWDCSLSVADLEDLRDDVGIGGSWSDFLDYLKSSLSSGAVKLLFAADQLQNSPGADGAKIVATKAKGLPRITIALSRVTGAAVSDVVAEFSLALYASYRTMQEHASRDQQRISQLMGSLSSERGTREELLLMDFVAGCLLPQENNEIMQKQLEALSFLDRRKATKPKLVADQIPTVCGVTVVSDQVIAPVQQQTPVASPSKPPPVKATKRVAPISRRLCKGQGHVELCCKIMRMMRLTEIRDFWR